MGPAIGAGFVIVEDVATDAVFCDSGISMTQQRWVQ